MISKDNTNFDKSAQLRTANQKHILLLWYFYCKVPRKNLFECIIQGTSNEILHDKKQGENLAIRKLTSIDFNIKIAPIFSS